MDNKEKYLIIAETETCSILCCTTLFITSHRFVNAEITPKWLGLMLMVGIMGIAWGVFYRKAYLPAKPVFLLLTGCFLFIFARGWVTSGFNTVLFMYMGGLLLLFFVAQQMVAVCPPRYLYGVAVLLATTLSIQGILQFFGIIPSANNNFAVTGSFDNPAGFAVALACAWPLCFHFFTHPTKYVRYAAMAAAALMAGAVSLSGSRTGILALMVATAVWLFAQLKIKNRSSRIIPAVVILALPVVLYFFKKDSANGRLLIWRTSLDMVVDKPVWGHGAGAFKANYMLCQAEYLNAHPDSRYAQLADNTLHPFNEFLLVLCEHGIVGLCMIALLAFLLFCAYRRNHNDEKLPALMSLSALAVFSFFSYPFRYPFTWVMLFLNMAVICNNPDVRKVYHGYFALKRNIPYGNIPRIAVFLLSSGLLAYSVVLTRAEIKWNRIAHLSLAGKTREVLPEYDHLYRWLGKDGLFLYNHAAELHEAREYTKSIAAFEHCTRYYNDMDVQLLLAYNYKALEKYTEAEEHLKTATAMCPARFIPLYELAKLYETIGRRDEVLAIAKVIIDKDVKIPSPTVAVIKNEMRQLVEARETLDVPENNIRTSDDPKNEKTRQGEMPHGAALPP